MVRAQRGDGDAFDQLAAASIDRLYAIAQRVLRRADFAEDAVQEALLAAWRDLPQLRDPAAFDVWLNRLLVRACYREARHRRLRPVVALSPGLEPGHPDQTKALADRDEMDRAFQRLSVDHRVVLVVTHYLGLSGPEAAEVLGLPPGTVKSRLHHATRALRAIMEADARGTTATTRAGG